MDRKQKHIDLASSQRSSGSAFDLYTFEHCALPNFDFNDISLETQFLGFNLSAPLLISSMTGGTEEACIINRNLISAAQECGIPLAVGSQRISLESGRHSGLGPELRRIAKDVPLFGNVGLANLIKWQDPDMLAKCALNLEADGMFIHLNPMQEVFQDKGDLDWSQADMVLKESISACPIPVIVKEVGMGLDITTARLSKEAGADAIDIAGKGGTDFISIEGSMAVNQRLALAAQVFSKWGQSTPSLLEQLSKDNFSLPIVASGGIRNGLDVAKSLALGASIAGIAGRILPAARQSDRACINVIEQIKLELKIACWGTANSNINDLRAHPLDK